MHAALSVGDSMRFGSVQLYGRPPAVQIGRRGVGLLARDGARAANLSVMSPRHARIAHNKCRSPAGVH